MSAGGDALPIVGRCTKCGREFVSFPDNQDTVIDPYLDIRSDWRHGAGIVCNGIVERLMTQDTLPLPGDA